MKLIGAIFALTVLATSATQAQSNLVQQVELMLEELGYDPGTIDNVVDEALQQAIAQYQQDRGLTVTGGLTLEDFAALEQAIAELRAANELQEAQPATPILPLPSSAQPASGTYALTQTTLPGGYIYHQMEFCDGERGIVLVTSVLTQSSPAVHEFSDICWFENEGRLEGVHTMANLTLVEDRPDGYQLHEDLLSGADNNQGWRSSITVFRPTVENFENFLVGSDYLGFSIRDVMYGLGGEGRLHVDQFSPSGARAPFDVNLVVNMGINSRLIERSALCQRGGTEWLSGPDYAEFQGTVDIRESGVVAFTSFDRGSANDQVSLTIEIDEHGVLTGAGQVHLENPRLAGHETCEWLTATIDITTVLGSTSTTQWQSFGGMALGFGSYTDIHGGTYPLEAFINIDGFPEGLLAQ